MALTELAIPPGQTQGQTMQATPTGPGASFSQNGPILHGGLLQQPGPGLGYIGDGIHHRIPLPMPIRPPNFIGIQPQPPIFGGLQPAMPDYSGQFEKFGEQLGGFGEQLTGYGDALGTFNEQVGGMGKQFETISNRLDSVDKGLGSLGNQIASLENMQKAQPQEVTQPQPMPQQPMYSPFGFGLGALFGRRFF